MELVFLSNSKGRFGKKGIGYPFINKNKYLPFRIKIVSHNQYNTKRKKIQFFFSFFDKIYSLIKSLSKVMTQK